MAKIKAEVQKKVHDHYNHSKVAKSCRENLLGRAVATKLGLIKHLDEVNIFGNVGKLKGNPVKIVLQKGAKPYSVTTLRHVPVPQIPNVEE